MKKRFLENKAAVNGKLKEALVSVIPIIIIVLILCFTVTPLHPSLLLSFLLGAAMIIVGMAVFTLGADSSMIPIGNRLGTTLTKSRKLPVILFVSFVLGVAITVAEPDLQVLARTVPHIDSTVLLLTVGAGVGLFLAVCMLRVILGIKLRWLLIGCYIAVFVLAFFTDKDYLSIAFDSGGVTTGPMTVPFILAFGIGVSNIRSDKKAASDSFGLVALCSIGPILAVLLLGLFYKGGNVAHEVTVTAAETTVDIGRAYLQALPTYMLEMAIALAPIVALFLLFQLFAFKLPKRVFLKIMLGLLYTYVGLILFLTGVNVGFSALGTILGGTLSQGWTVYLLIPLAMLLGWFIISAEPAVYVLEKQIEQVTSGAINGKGVKISLSVAIALAMGLSMLRVITGISILWFLVPGYAISLALSFFVPDIFTAIAFDSGGVASGPMTATFMLQFAIGASTSLNGNASAVLKDAFGIVALVAMMPLITIQIMGVFYKQKRSRALAKPEVSFGDCDVIELWG